MTYPYIIVRRNKRPPDIYNKLIKLNNVNPDPKV